VTDTNRRNQYAQWRIAIAAVEPQNESMRPVEFGEALAAGTRLTLFSDDKPDRVFTVITFWIDKVSP
jgi:hypothetical protein